MSASLHTEMSYLSNPKNEIALGGAAIAGVIAVVGARTLLNMPSEASIQMGLFFTVCAGVGFKVAESIQHEWSLTPNSRESATY